MTTDEYMPSEEDAVDNYVSGRGGDDPGLSLAELRAEYGPEFDRFVAHVRRDAAREALDGLVGALNTSVHEIQNGPNPNPVEWQTGALWTRDLAKIHRDTHYPEESP